MVSDKISAYIHQSAVGPAEVSPAIFSGVDADVKGLNMDFTACMRILGLSTQTQPQRLCIIIWSALGLAFRRWADTWCRSMEWWYLDSFDNVSRALSWVCQASWDCCTVCLTSIRQVSCYNKCCCFRGVLNYIALSIMCGCPDLYRLYHYPYWLVWLLWTLRPKRMQVSAVLIKWRKVRSLMAASFSDTQPLNFWRSLSPYPLLWPAWPEIANEFSFITGTPMPFAYIVHLRWGPQSSSYQLFG